MEKNKIIEEYLKEKPNPRKGFWANMFYFLAVAAKAYLRYEELKND